MPRDRFDDFDRHFSSTRRAVGIVWIIGLLWVLFLMGAIGTGLWILGRWTGVW